MVFHSLNYTDFVHATSHIMLSNMTQLLVSKSPYGWKIWMRGEGVAWNKAQQAPLIFLMVSVILMSDIDPSTLYFDVLHDSSSQSYRNCSAANFSYVSISSQLTMKISKAKTGLI